MGLAKRENSSSKSKSEQKTKTARSVNATEANSEIQVTSIETGSAQIPEKVAHYIDESYQKLVNLFLAFAVVVGLTFVTGFIQMARDTIADKDILLQYSQVIKQYNEDILRYRELYSVQDKKIAELERKIENICIKIKCN